METITAKQTREILRKRWPDLKHIWIFDRRLTLPILQNVQQALNDVQGWPGRFYHELFDCDDYALVTHALIKGWVASRDKKPTYNWAFGECSMDSPDLGIHNQNIFITDDHKVWFYDPQNRQMIEPKNEKTFYVRM